MRFSRTLFGYLSLEILQYTGLGFVTLTTVLVSQNALRRLDDVVSVGATFSDFVVVMRCFVPMLTSYTLPMAFLFGVLFAVSRLSADSELLAMRASGLGVGMLLAPALALGMLVSALTATTMVELEHRAHRQLRTVIETVAARGGFLEPGEFRGFGNRTIYIESRDRSNQLRGVMIADRHDAERPYLIFAERGRFSYDEEQSEFRIDLEQGAIHLEGRDSQRSPYRRISFGSLSYVFDVHSLISGLTAAVRPRQMSSEELRDVIARGAAGEELADYDQRDPVAYELELQRRFAFPVAPILFALIGVPLGMRSSRSARVWGALLSLLVAFGYYFLLSFVQILAEDRWLSPAVALWIPNAVCALLAAVLIRSSNRAAAS
ncbi:MAG: LptF/LptG family permease [Deltaproteobacteria bacterium]|nr:LptF/LptG family permease [Deltaproteobacteria bacterium]MBW2420718.1 LptF/LptG family permease [Deltaproteobacteria bacterium]